MAKKKVEVNEVVEAPKAEVAKVEAPKALKFSKKQFVESKRFASVKTW